MKGDSKDEAASKLSSSSSSPAKGNPSDNDTDAPAPRLLVSNDDPSKKCKKETKKKKKDKKKKRKKEKERSSLLHDDDGDHSSSSVPLRKKSRTNADHTTTATSRRNSSNHKFKLVPGDDKIVQTSARDFASTTTTTTTTTQSDDVTLLLFYQYVDPPWDTGTYQKALEHMQHLGDTLSLTGRMRVAREGLNCTLTATHAHILQFCQALRRDYFQTNGEFQSTEFKLTTDLPRKQLFPQLKVMPVAELVHYGLEGEKAPPITYTGQHLEPTDYHEKLAQDDTVVIDVRNHYEAAIGRFDPPGAKWLDPEMRKSTEFPVWLQKESTQEQLRGKQVLMYCTGGVRCERASALLKYKMETDPSIQQLNIQGVYQLQGGIDKYFKQYSDGGYWRGKNYTFDKRFAHAPAQVEARVRSRSMDETASASPAKEEVMGSCEACDKPWDMYRGKRRCPTCGVPSLICRSCMEAHKDGTKKLDHTVRCDLCVKENVTSKAELRRREQQEVHEYEAEMKRKGIAIEWQKPQKQGRVVQPAPNPDGVTRLLVKNMCRKNTTEETLMDALPGITHIVWKTDRRTGNFFGSGWVEMATPTDAARAVGMSGKRVLGRPIYISYEPPDGKDAWPPRSSTVRR